MLNNNPTQYILLSPDVYIRLHDEITDARLLTTATTRMVEADLSSFIPADQLYAEMGITPEELDKIDLADSELSMV